MKAYREPNVWIDVVEDEFAFAGPTMNMRPIYYGTLFQVESKLSVGSYVNGSGLASSYPSIKVGADVDTDSVGLFLVHNDTGAEYDITDGLVVGGVIPTITGSTITVPAYLYDEMIDSTSGARAAGGYEFSDSGESFVALMYGDRLVLVDNANETVVVNQVDSDGNVEVLIQYAKNMLYYDGKVAGKTFSVGDTVVGGTTGAVAEVLDVHLDASGVAGYILLGVLNPAATSFQNNEDLKVNTVKIAVANGVQALVGTDKRLAFHTLTAPAAIKIGDVLEGVTGTDQILNGDFAINLNDWTAGVGWAPAGAKAAVTAGVGNTSLVQAVSTFASGKAYHLTVDVVITIGTSITVSAGGVTLGVITATGAYGYNFVALSAAALSFTPTVNVTGTIDDVVCGEATAGTVLYVVEKTATTGFVLLDMTTAGFVNGEALNVGLLTVANADGTERDISGAYGMIDSPSVIYYDALTSNFLAGHTLTGAISTAHAEILYVYKSGTSGYLLLGTVDGVFQDNETIADDQAVPGSATSYGLDAKAEISQVLYYDALSAPGAIAIGDVLRGAAGARGTVLYLQDNNSAGFAYLSMEDPNTVFVDNENLNVGAGTIAKANGTNNYLSITVARDYEIRRYLNGVIYASYRAARSDLDGEVYYISKYSQLLDLVGGELAVIPENPLAYAGKLCTSLLSDCFLVPVQDLEGYQDSNDSTNSSAWASALLLAKNYETGYGYVVLSQNDTVRALLEVAVNWRRDPDNYRTDVVGYFCPARVQEDVAISQRISSIGATDANTWRDGNISDFVSYGCLPGRTLELIDVAGVAGDEDVVYKFTLAGVQSDELTTVEAMTALQQTITTYRVVNSYFTADEEALYYAVYGDSIQNKGIRLIYPPTSQFGGKEVPGYYYGVIRAAQLNVNNPATIYTKAVVPFVEKAISSFDRDQLNTVASGGIMVFYEANTDLGSGSSPVKCRDAITTDRSSAVREEEVVVTEVDFCSRYIRSVFDPEQGKYHNDEMLDDGIATLSGGCKTYLEKEVRCVQKIDLVNYEIDVNNVRKILYEWSLKPRIPNKWADMTIHVVT